MSDKPRFSAAAAKDVARELVRELKPNCEPGRLIVAGSLRRRKADVGDVEFVFIGKPGKIADPRDLFGALITIDFAETIIERWLLAGVLVKRPNVEGRTSWGALNKFAVHVASGIPIDLFTATAANWGNYVVCRTGGSETNKAICNAAIERGWHWSPYGAGFKRTWQGQEQVHECRTEEEVFAFAGLPFLPPWERK